MIDSPDLSAYPGVRWKPADENDRKYGNPDGSLLVDVTLRRVSDGVERISVAESSGFFVYGGNIDEAIEHARYWWHDGNGGCDCNRQLYFERAAGGDPDIEAVECTHGRYRIVAPEWLAEDAR